MSGTAGAARIRLPRLFQHRMLLIPEEHWEKALKLLYAEKFDWSHLMSSIGAAVVEGFYDKNVVFLRFCFAIDRNGKTSLETMLKRWYTALEKEYHNQTTG